MQQADCQETLEAVKKKSHSLRVTTHIQGSAES